MTWAAGLLSVSYFLSLILGALRDRLLATNFGNSNGVSSITDAYYAAFKFPDFMFVLLVSGALSVTLIPVFNQRYQSGNKKSSWELVNSLLNFLVIATLFASILTVIFADFIIKDILARGLDVNSQNDAVAMMRILAINPIIFSISNIFVSVQQAVGRFFFFALAPITYNLCIIFGILFLGEEYGIFGAVIGVVVGAFVQMLVSFMGMRGLGFSYEKKIFWNNQGFKEVLKLLPPRSVDQSMDFFMGIVETGIAGTLKNNAITMYTYANSLHLAPISLIGVAISTAAFPKMGERIDQGRSDLFKKEIRSVLQLVTWLALPVCAITLLGRGYFVRLQLGAGNATVSDILGLLVISIFFRVIFHVISRAFYANRDTKTPLFISTVAIIFNIILAVYLVFYEDDGIFGIAIAQSLVAAFEVIAMFIIFNKKYQNFINTEFIISVVKMMFATVAMSVVTYWLVSRVFPLRIDDIGFSTLIPKIGLIVSISFLVYMIVSKIFGIKEVDPFFEKIIKITERPIK